MNGVDTESGEASEKNGDDVIHPRRFVGEPREPLLLLQVVLEIHEREGPRQLLPKKRVQHRLIVQCKTSYCCPTDAVQSAKVSPPCVVKRTCTGLLAATATESDVSEQERPVPTVQVRADGAPLTRTVKAPEPPAIPAVPQRTRKFFNVPDTTAMGTTLWVVPVHVVGVPPGPCRNSVALAVAVPLQPNWYCIPPERIPRVPLRLGTVIEAEKAVFSGTRLIPPLSAGKRVMLLKNWAAPFAAKVPVMEMPGVKLIVLPPVKDGVPEKTGLPLKVGLPVKVPAREPPPVTVGFVIVGAV